MKSQFQRSFRYDAWANSRVIESLAATPAASDEALPLLAHLLAAEHIWFCRLTGRAAEHEVFPSLTLDACRRLANANTAGYAELLAQATDDWLQSPVAYHNAAGLPFENRAADILTHVVTHGPYHRGQIAKAIGRNGGQPTPTDYIVFAREQDGGPPVL
ncbi:DinB family protein [Posidoniimonas polymericola]|uniref:DinB family protein n=1 Tax=Posidoniimonas polymericola TaxID=2528002 RepID=A0A5C5YFA1_9BACT|nr:DinB family protein [Posidoniimonas polymericola]TWT73473.1 DinB family protein [Posidoniimonas polymericola]